MSGRIRTFKTSRSGREQVLAIEGAGRSVAELPVLDGRAATIVMDGYARQGSDRARDATAQEFKANRYDASSGSIAFTAGQSNAYGQLVSYYGNFFSEPTTRFGLRPSAMTDSNEIKHLVAFFA
jgi:nitric oxide reductase subunit B